MWLGMRATPLEWASGAGDCMEVDARCRKCWQDVWEVQVGLLGVVFNRLKARFLCVGWEGHGVACPKTWCQRLEWDCAGAEP